MRNSIYINEKAVLEYTAKVRKNLTEYTYKELAYTGQGIRQLLSKASHKFEMTNGKEIVTKGMYLSPSDEMSTVLGIKKFTTCGNETKLCRSACLKNTGKMTFKTSINARVMRTALFYAYPIEFLDALIDEIFSEDRISSQKGFNLQVRLNGTSDIPWENFINMGVLIQDTRALKCFYDYSKWKTRQSTEHYKLIYSVAENSKIEDVLEFLALGSIAVVVDAKSHKNLIELKSPYIIDGDISDHRPQDPIGSIVILKFKPSTKKKENNEKDHTGFIKNSNWVKNLIEEFKIS